MDYRVSVIVPTFNRSSTLPRALQSIMNQTLPPHEIIVIDDGSSDETETIVTRDFPEVIYFRQDHRGVSAARNRGIQMATGNWIAFLDSDDEWLPTKLEKQVGALKANPDYRICHTNEIWIRRGRRVNPKKKHQKYGGHIFVHCLPLCIISPSSVLLHRHLFTELGMFDEQLPACEDYDLWLRICAVYPVLYLEEPLIVKHGGHEDQLSRQFWGMDRFRIYALEKILRTGELPKAYQIAALKEILRKISIYLQGARKRQRWEEVQRYQQKYDQYQEWLQRIDKTPF
ncbi:MAG: glycosyltransferase family 2 protein [Calditrichaeota bacterium]|nr:glycosyltransferase family 2 protein [Calditrichota bacterium]